MTNDYDTEASALSKHPYADAIARLEDTADHRIMAKAFALASKALGGEIFVTGSPIVTLDVELIKSA